MELEISSLKARVAQLEAQSNEYFHMRLQKDVMCTKISKLQAEISLKQKKIRKLKSKTAKHRKDLYEKANSLERMENHLKKIWGLLLVFGDKLKRNGLLTTEERTGIKKEYEEWFSLLISLSNKNSEEIFTKLNDLPVGLLEVLNDSECSSQSNSSQTCTSNINQEQSSISVKSNKDLIPEHEHSSYACLSPKSSISSEINSTNCDEIQSKDHNITVLKTLTVEDFVTNDDAFDDELWKLNSGNSTISNNEQIKVESDHSSLKSSCQLKDLSDTESCDKNNPDLVTHQQCVERTTNDQEVNENKDFTFNNIPKNTTCLLKENCSDNPDDVNTIFSSLHTNFMDIETISKDKNVDSESKTDKPKSDFSNIQPSSSNISNNIIKKTKSPKRKISKLNKFKLKVIKGNKFGKSRIHPFLQKANQCTTTKNIKIPFHSTPLSNRSLELHCNSDPKENPQSQSESVVNNPNQNKRTVLIPGPPLKITRESPLLKDLECQKISNSYQKESFPIDSAKKSKEFGSCSLQPAKKPKLVLRKEISDVAPVRVRGRTLFNRGLLRMKDTELKDNDTTVNQCSEEVDGVGQVCASEHGSTVNSQIPEGDFFPTNKHKKIRLEHKRILLKDTSKSINKSIDDTDLCKDPNTTETQTSLPCNTATNSKNNNKNVLKDLLKKAESSKNIPIQDSTFNNLTLQKYFKSKRRERNRNRFNVSGFNAFKRGISKFAKHKTIVVNSKRSTKLMSKLSKSKSMKDSMISIETSCVQDVQMKSDSDETSVQITPEVVSNKLIQMMGASFENDKKDSSDVTSKTACTTVTNSESISSKENVFSVPQIEDDCTQPANQINSICRTSSVTEKGIVDNIKSTNSLFKSISENDADLKKAQDIEEDQNHDPNLFLDRKHNSSPRNDDDSDYDCPLVIDENFGVDQQLAEKQTEPQSEQFEIKHDKFKNGHKIFQNESNKNSIDRNASEDIIKNNSNMYGLDIDSTVLIKNNLGCGEHCKISEEISKAPQDNNSTINSDHGRVYQSNDFETMQHNSLLNMPTTSKHSEFLVCSREVEENLVSNELPKHKDSTNKNQIHGSENKIDAKPKVVIPKSEIKNNNTQVKEHNTSYPCLSNKKNHNNRFASNKKILNRSLNNAVPKKSGIEIFFEEYQNKVFTEENFKQNIKILSNFLLNPTNFPDNSVILLHTLNYLYTCKKNPLLSYSADEDLFPLDEKCLVEVFLLIESKKKQHLDGLVKCAVETIYYIIVSYKNSLTLFGLASLCRVLTAICKEKGDQRKPVFLCGDLLKRRHDFAPYLIASVASIWKELFQIDSNMPAEECLFHSCVLYGATRRISRKLHECFWKSSTEFILKHFTALPLRDVKLSIQMLQQIIQDRCEDESWDYQYLSSALIILASIENWDWIERHLMTEFILSNMNKYGKISLNPIAFDLFCNMYVETILLRPGNPLDTILTCFINNSTHEDAHFVQATAALALMRFVLKKNRKLPPFLNDWFEHNKDNAEVIKIKSYYETLTLYVNHYQNNNINK